MNSQESAVINLSEVDIHNQPPTPNFADDEDWDIRKWSIRPRGSANPRERAMQLMAFGTASSETRASLESWKPVNAVIQREDDVTGPSESPERATTWQERSRLEKERYKAAKKLAPHLSSDEKFREYQKTQGIDIFAPVYELRSGSTNDFISDETIDGADQLLAQASDEIRRARTFLDCLRFREDVQKIVRKKISLWNFYGESNSGIKDGFENRSAKSTVELTKKLGTQEDDLENDVWAKIGEMMPDLVDLDRASLQSIIVKTAFQVVDSWRNNAIFERGICNSSVELIQGWEPANDKEESILDIEDSGPDWEPNTDEQKPWVSSRPKPVDQLVYGYKLNPDGTSDSVLSFGNPRSPNFRPAVGPWKPLQSVAVDEWLVELLQNGPVKLPEIKRRAQAEHGWGRARIDSSVKRLRLVRTSAGLALPLPV